MVFYHDNWTRGSLSFAQALARTAFRNDDLRIERNFKNGNMPSAVELKEGFDLVEGESIATSCGNYRNQTAEVEHVRN
jgi:hypothetical protein